MGERRADSTGRSSQRRAASVGQRSFVRHRQQSRRRRVAGARRLTLAGARRPIAKLVGSVPTAAWVCVVAAILNAACWSLITPPFAVSDESSHFAYVKQLAEAHALPHSHGLEFSREEERALIDLHEFPAGILPPTGAISSVAEQHRLEHDLAEAAEQPREGSDAAGVATSQPPLYYLLETIPYTIGSSGSLLTRLELMRLLSALYAGVTALFAFFFVREALPARRLGWVAGGLSVAFAPLLGFMSGAVNPDALLFAVSAGLFWSLARAFRLGLTYRRASLIGVIAAIGLLTKLNFVGLLPGALLGLAVLAWGVRRSSRSDAYRMFGLGAGLAISPAVAYMIANAAAGTPLIGEVSTVATSLAKHSVSGGVSYIWQMFLPRLPGMKPYFAGLFTTREIWFDGLVGEFGWVETAFPGWVYDVAGLVAVLVFFACARVLWLLRSTVRRRVLELAVYTVISVGLLILVGGVSSRAPATEQYTEARYLLPLIVLFAAAIGLAIRACGRRWEAILGTLIVLAMIADNVFSQLLVIGRFYA